MQNYQDKLKFGVVTMHVEWGELNANIEKMDAFIAEAAAKGCNMLLFPELCTTGYCDGLLPDGRRIHPALALEPNGAVAQHFGALAKEHNMYIIYGTAEAIPGDGEHAYNSAFIADPQGNLSTYRKIHPVEPDWCVGGTEAMVLDTPWGPMGMSVCYDTYAIPELQRYYAARGCRMLLNPTASLRGINFETGEPSGWYWYYTRRLETIADRDGIFVASANPTGFDGPKDAQGKQLYQFPGGSVVISPEPSKGKYVTWAVGAPTTPDEGLFCGKLDLSHSKREFFASSIYRPDLYATWYEELAAKTQEPPTPEQQSIRIAVSNFDTAWGDVEDNLTRMIQQTEEAAEQGANLVVFPELALTGYWYKSPKKGALCMQQELAETIPGPSTQKLSKLAAEKGIYLVVGMPEKDAQTGLYYNSTAILTPQGETLCYRKIHPIGDEQKWATAGETPLMFDTPWGPIGMSVCYDTYFVPELIRYYSASGAKIILNPTATIKGLPEGRWQWYYRSRLESSADRDGVIIASSNLCGPDGIPMKIASFPGGSVVMGASWTEGIYHGGAIENNKPGMIVSQPVDLTNVKFQIFYFQPEIYAKLYRDIQKRKEEGTL